MTPPLPNSHTRDLEALLHPYANSVALRETGLQIITRGEGVRFFDDTGRGYIEGMAGLWCAGLGFSDVELIDAAKEQMDKLPYYHLFGNKSHEPAVDLAEKSRSSPLIWRAYFISRQDRRPMKRRPNDLIPQQRIGAARKEEKH